MSTTFKVTITDDQERDLYERALASGYSMAQLIGGAITDRLFNNPVDVEEIESQPEQPGRKG